LIESVTSGKNNEVESTTLTTSVEKVYETPKFESVKADDVYSVPTCDVPVAQSSPETNEPVEISVNTLANSLPLTNVDGAEAKCSESSKTDQMHQGSEGVGTEIDGNEEEENADEDVDYVPAKAELKYKYSEGKLC
jgi:hypothetical protein